MIGVNGIMILGKYTFVNIDVAFNKLELDPERAEEKYVQGTSAVKVK